MTEITVVQKKARKGAKKKSSLNLGITIEFGQDADSAREALEKLVEILRLSLSPDEIRELLTEMQGKLQAALSAKKAG